MRELDFGVDSLAEGDHPSERKHFILPQFINAMGYSCAREWAESSIRFQCGCPRCLRKVGLSLTFHPEDWNEAGDCQPHWRKLIVSEKTGRLASHLIVPGYVFGGAAPEG